MTDKDYEVILHQDQGELDAAARLTALLKESPLPDGELLANLGLYLSSKNLSRLLFFYEMYKKVVDLHGVIFDFGTRWGQNAAVLSSLRGIFEPFNRIRKIVAFDTFGGLVGVSGKDGESSHDGAYSLSEGYESYLAQVLDLQEQLSPLGHIKKYEVVKGDVAVTLPDYLAKHPETMVALAVFDMDIYTPTKSALEALKPFIGRGTVIIFDELCDEVFPGETTALREAFDLRRVQIKRLSMTSRLAYLEVE